MDGRMSPEKSRGVADVRGEYRPYTRLPDTRRFRGMKHLEQIVNESGKIGYALLWLLGVPLPILLVIYLVRGH